jgi:chemotaxis protein MotB
VVLSDHSDNAPIIIKRGKRRRHSHHGGAWKVAFADFAIAMMAFFLVLWLSEAATIEQKASISGYFEDPVGFSEQASVFVIDMEGAALQKEEGQSKENQDDPNDLNRISTKEELKGLISADAVQGLAQQIEQQRFDQLMKEMQARIDQSPELSEYKDQILMSVTPEGLLIQIVDKKSRPMFDSGSARLKPYIYIILRGVADLIGSIPNKISISGHTDAVEFEGRRNFTNWELSSERANAARRALVQSGMDGQQVAEVVGLASSQLLDRDKPQDPINRRISILALSKKSQAQLDQRLGGETINSDGEKVTISTAQKKSSASALPEIEAPEVELNEQEPDEKVDQRPLPDVDTAPEQSNNIDKAGTSTPLIRREGWKKILPAAGASQQDSSGSESTTKNNPPAFDDSDELF